MKKSRIACSFLSLLFLFSISVFGQQPVLHYTFDEVAGDAIDLGIEPSANGALQPNAMRTSNTPGGFSPFALDLSAPGIESWVTGGDAAKVDTLTSFTFTTWLNLQGLNEDQDGNGNVRLLAKQAAAPFNGFSWNLNNPLDGERGTDNFRLGMFVGGVEAFGFGQSTESLDADDRWVFLAATYDGTEEFDNLNFYVGDEMAEVSLLGLPLSIFAGPVLSTTGEATVNIGATDAAPEVDFAANGYQDDVRIYNQVLSESQLDAIRLENLGPAGQAGDFNGDGVIDATDIDLLTLQVRNETHLADFDLTSDGLVDETDRIHLITKSLFTYFGDANLDLEFNSSDLVAVFQKGEYEDGIPANSTWSSGDWNGDGEFDSTDFVTAFGEGGYELGRRVAAKSIPESHANGLVGVIGVFYVQSVRRRKRS